MARRIVLVSPLSPTAIATRLLEVLGDCDDQPKKGVTGQGSDSEMRLFNHRPNFANSFRAELVATMELDGSGTRITGTMGSPAHARIFMGCWFGFLGLFIGVAALLLLLSGRFAPVMAPLVLIPVAMVGFGVLLLKAGTWNAAKDEAAILEFLEQTVQARLQ